MAKERKDEVGEENSAVYLTKERRQIVLFTNNFDVKKITE